MCQLPLLLSTKEPGMSQGSATTGPIFGRRIVFYGVAEDVNEPTLLQLLSKYGEVSGLFLVRSALGLPSGCGYATMATAEQAAAVVEALQGSTECAETGGKLGLLVVQTAAPAGDQQQEDSSSAKAAKDSRTVFFTKVPPTVTAHQLIQLFTACGEVVHVELFTPWPGAKISKGCGLVEFARMEAAAAAVNSLHLAFTWPHSHSPLVVEWLDSKRQVANRANKLSKHSSCDGTGAPIRRAVTVPMDRAAVLAAQVQGSAAMYSAAAAGFNGVSGQLGMQQQSSRSCPLPRLQATASGSWVQSTPAWPGTGYAHLPTTALPQVQEQGGYYLQQQQQGELPAAAMAAGHQNWWLPHQVSSGMNSVASTYDHSSSVSMTAASTLSNASTVLQVSGADISTGSLACCPVSNAMAAMAAADDLAPYSGCQSPVALSDTSLAAAATAALGAGRVNPAWQQLQQQNIMLLQPMSNPVDDLADTTGQRTLLPGTTAAYVAECQTQALQLSNAAATELYTGLTPASAGITLQQQQQQQYQPQLPHMQPGGLYAAGSRLVQQQQQQWWWSLQQQRQQQQQLAQAASEEPIMAVPLSARQLQAMSVVLPEVPRLTGAKTLLSACNVGSGVQLVLSGQASAVQAAHSVVSVLLSNMGIDEPLMPALMMQQS